MFSFVDSLKTISVRLRLISALGLVAACLTGPAMADDESTKDRFQFHGFLTQAYATANFTENGPTAEEVIVGIPEDG
ncbi:MAG: hypothetical protein AAGE94_20205, partial [Acidobacteriota bacterium]